MPLYNFILSFYNQFIDYEGKSSRKTFWLSILCVLIAGLFYVVLLSWMHIRLAGNFFHSFIFSAITLFIVTSLIIRRLRDAGYNVYLSVIWLINILLYPNELGSVFAVIASSMLAGMIDTFQFFGISIVPILNEITTAIIIANTFIGIPYLIYVLIRPSKKADK